MHKYFRTVAGLASFAVLLTVSTKMAAVEIPKPVINIPKPVINVARPVINVPRPAVVVNVPKPVVNIPRPAVTVNVSKPAVVVPKPTIAVNVPKPTVPAVNVPKPIPVVGVPKPVLVVGKPTPTKTVAKPALAIEVAKPEQVVGVAKPSQSVTPSPQRKSVLGTMGPEVVKQTPAAASALSGASSPLVGTGAAGQPSPKATSTISLSSTVVLKSAASTEHTPQTPNLRQGLVAAAGVTGFDAPKPMRLPDGKILQPYTPSSNPTNVAPLSQVSISDRIGSAEVRLVQAIQKDYSQFNKALAKLWDNSFASKPSTPYLIVNNGTPLQESPSFLPKGNIITGQPAAQGMTSWIAGQYQETQKRLNGGY